MASAVQSDPNSLLLKAAENCLLGEEQSLGRFGYAHVVWLEHGPILIA